MQTGTIEAVSNQSSWADYGFLIDAETGEACKLDHVTEIEMVIRDLATRTNMLTATMSGGGVTIASGGEFDVYEFSFTAAQMQTLCARTHELAIRITAYDETVQLVRAELPVLDGIKG
jgi:predicted small secreted protein